MASCGKMPIENVRLSICDVSETDQLMGGQAKLQQYPYAIVDYWHRQPDCYLVSQEKATGFRSK